MLNSTAEADDVGDYLRVKYPAEFGANDTGRAQLLVIHTDRSGDVSKKDLDCRERSRSQVDEGQSPVNAIVSVLMLREGWDVQNVTVIVGLRPYTAKANILPEQTIGRDAGEVDMVHLCLVNRRSSAVRRAIRCAATWVQTV